MAVTGFNKITSGGEGSTLSQSLLPDSLFYNTRKSKDFQQPLASFCKRLFMNSSSTAASP
jgi:hypothetical protein